MKTSVLFAAIVTTLALSAAPARAERHTYSFHCSSNAVLRVTFDDESNTAIVSRIRQPLLRLTQVETPSGFRYTRGESYELAGDLSEVRWRVGRAEWTCPRGG